MKESKRLTALVAGIAIVVGATVVACGPKVKPPPQEGSETGVYYYDAVSGDEYKLSMYEGDKATLVMGNILTGGTYTRAEADLSFSFVHKDVGEVSAVFDEAAEVVTLSYKNTDMRFLRCTEYTVTYDSQSGSAVESATVINGKTLAKPEDPTRDGYTFIGWYTDSEYKTPFMFGTQPITENITLYAQWGQNVFGQNTYTIKFDSGYDGAPAIASKQTVGGKLYDVQTPSRDGYEFRGWWYSMTGKPDELTYRVDADTVFNENTTLYAVWHSAAQSGKLPQPLVSVNSQLISWDAISNAGSYIVEIEGPSGFDYPATTVSATSIKAPFTVTGEYTVTVTAKDKGSESNNSDPAVRHYVHNGLTRVSLFSVVEPSTLLFNAVDNAEKYLIDIDCGDEGHNHSPFDNGSSTNFNFGNCQMQDGGIKFTVTAVANGYASSVSDTFVYNKILDKISELSFDAATETVSWQSVPNATNYVVSVKCGNHEHKITDIGSKTSYSLKECAQFVGNEEAGTTDGIVFNVYPRTKGYNSPEPTSYTYNKNIPATPSDIRIVKNTLSWTAVAGENVAYRVRIGNIVKEVATNSFDLSTLTEQEVTWTEGEDYVINVATVVGEVSSSWSDNVDARYYALYSSLSYNRNTVSWRRVIGVDGYQVKVDGNNSSIINITNGDNFAVVTLMKSGINTIEVRYIDGDNYSEWVSMPVYAYAVTFDTREGQVIEGKSISTHYYAIGDKVSLPTEADIEKEGYEFDGWYNTPGGAAGNGARYLDEYFTESGDVILYANWKAKTYKLTLDYNNGGDGEKVAEAKFGNGFSLPTPISISDPSKVFIGWALTSVGTATITDYTGKSNGNWIYPEDRTLYAVWLTVYKYSKHIGGDAGYYYSVSAILSSPAVREITIPVKYKGESDDVEYPVDQLASNLFGKNFFPNLEIVNIPASITSNISLEMFTGLYAPEKLKSINVYSVPGVAAPKYFSENGILYNNNATTGEVEVWGVPRGITGEFTLSSKATRIPTKIFYYSNISELKIPSSITEIAYNAFYMAKIKKLTFLSDVGMGKATAGVNIMSGAFGYMSNLTDIHFPSHKVVFADRDGKELKNVNFFSDVFLTGLSSSKIERIEVESGNPDYVSVDGMLCRNDSDHTLIYVPKTRTGTEGEKNQIFTIPNGIYSIGQYAFAGCSKITELVIPNYVSKIEDGAFTGFEYKQLNDTIAVLNACPLTKVTFSKMRIRPIAIGNYAFGHSNKKYSCDKLSNIVFESNCNVVSIGKYSFANTAVKEITFPQSLKTVDEYAFAFCTNLKEIKYENLGVNSSDLTYEANAFAECTALEHFYFAINVVEIADSGIFNGCYNLAAVDVADGNVYFSTDQGVLFRNLMQTVKDPEGNDVLDEKGDPIYVLDKNGKKIPVIEEGKYIWDTILYYPAGKKDGFVVPETVTRLGNGLFRKNKDIPSIVIHENVVFIGDDAFNGCTNISEIIIKDGSKLLNIGINTFKGCTNLSEIILPARVVKITESMFDSCTKLGSITINGAIESIGNSAFAGCISLNKVIIPGADSIDTGFGNNNIAYVPATVKTIGNNAFASCKGLSYVYFMPVVNAVAEDNDEAPDALTIGNEAFYESGVTAINLPTRLTQIGDRAFGNCSTMESINIPYTVKNIGAEAFIACYSLKNVVFDTPNDAKRGDLTFGSGLFTSCTALVSIRLPEGLTSIPTSCFSNCSGLRYVYIPNTVANGEWTTGSRQSAAVEAYAFNECVELGLDYVDEQGVTQKGGLEFQSGGIGNALSFANNAFFHCPSLTELNLPARLASALDSAGNEIFAFGDFGTLSGPEINKTNWNRTLGGAFVNDSRLERINIDENCENYFSYDGIPYWIQNEVPYWKEGFSSTTDTEKVRTVTLGFCPKGRKGSVDISKDATMIFYKSFVSCTGVTEITFQAGGTEDLIIGSNVVTLSASGNWCDVFNGTSVTSMTLPARLKEICNQAFYQFNKLTSVTFENGGRLTRIGERAFQSCRNLISVTNIPSSVEVIDQYAFSGSQYVAVKLNEVTFASDGHYERKDVNGETVKDASGNIIYDKTALQKINSFAFAYSILPEFVVPSSVHTIGESAFDSTFRLTNIVLSANIQEFGGAFNNCYAKIQFPKDNENGNFGIPYSDDVIYSVDTGKTVLGIYPTTKTDTEYVVKPGTKKIAAGAFSGNPYIKKIIIPNSVSYIGNHAFMNCAALEEVYFVPDDGEDEAGNPYNNDNTATELIVGETVTGGPTNIYSSSITESSTYDSFTNVQASVFAYCEKLKKVNFPKRTVKLGARSFYKCYDLEEVTFADGCQMELLEYCMFANRSKLKTVKLPDGLKRMGSAYDNYAKEPKPMYELQSNGGNVFQNCTALKSITLPEGLEIIDDNCFSGSGITSIVIPSTVVRLGTKVFYNCKSLTAVEFAKGSKLEYFYYKSGSTSSNSGYANSGSNNTFEGCTALTTVTLPYTVKSTGDNLFSGCTNLATFKTWNNDTNTAEAVNGLPANIEYIGTAAFLKTKISGNITIAGSVTTIGKAAFAGTGITSVTFATEADSSSLNIVSGDNSTAASASSGAFAHCKNLKTVTFNNRPLRNSTNSSVAGNDVLGTATFQGCSELETVNNLSNALVKIQAYAFQNCTKLKNVLVQGDNEVSVGINIPGTVVVVEDSVFTGCSGIEKVRFIYGADTLQLKSTSSSNGIFANCKALKLVDFGGRTVNNGTTVNNSNANVLPTYIFYGAGSTGSGMIVRLPAELVKISSNSFATSGLVAFVDTMSAEEVDIQTLSVMIPSSVKTIDKNAFYNCKKMQSLSFSERASDLTIVDGTSSSTGAFAGTSLASITFPTTGVSDTGNYTFYGCASLAFVDFGGVSTVGSYAFANTGLIALNVSNSVNVISASAFRSNKKLESVTFTNLSMLFEIGDDAFTDCIKLAAFEIPASVTKLGDLSAFASCGSLTSLTVASGGSKFVSENNAVYSADKSILYAFATGAAVDFVLPSETIEIKQGAFYGSKITKFSAQREGEGTLIIPQYTFQYSGELAEVNIDRKASIGSNAFSYCSKLTKFNTLNNTEVDYNTFSNSSSVNSAEIFENVQLMYNGYKATTDGTVIISSDVENGAFKSDKFVKNIIITRDVISIGNNAFDGAANLSDVTFDGTPALKTIGLNAFKGTGITSFTVPSSVTKIDKAAFAGSKVQTIVIESSDEPLTLISGTSASATAAGAFGMATSLTSIDFNGRKLAVSGSGVNAKEAIPNYTFAGSTKLATIDNLSDSIVSVGNYAFNKTGFTSFTIPATWTSLGTYLFDGSTSLTSVTISEGITALPNYIFNGCTNLASITLPTSLVSVGNYAFAKTGFTSFIIPSSWTTIGTYLFSGCASLAAVTVSEGITAISSNMFNGCKNITSFTFPSSVTNIGDGAFYNSGLTGTFTIPGTVTTIGIYVFTGTNITDLIIAQSNSVLTIAAGSKETAGTTSSAFGGMTKLKSVNFNNRKLSEVSGRETLPAYIFAGDVLLEEVNNLSNTVASIGKYAFHNCKKLQSFDAVNVTYNIDQYAFYGCELIETMNLSNVKYAIGQYAFYNCKKLKTVTLPQVVDNASYLGAYSFYATAIESFTVPETVDKINNNMFENCKQLTTVVYSSTVKYTYNYAFKGCEALSNVQFNEDLQDVRTGSFEGCKALTTITLPENLKTIYENAFKDSGLTTIIIPSTVNDMRSNAFGTWTADQTIYVRYYPTRPQSWASDWSGNANVVWGYVESQDTPEAPDEPDTTDVV